MTTLPAVYQTWEITICGAIPRVRSVAGLLSIQRVVMLRPPLQELEFSVSVIRPPLTKRVFRGLRSPESCRGRGWGPGNGCFTLRGEADMESLGQEVDPFATRQISYCPLWLSLTHPAPLGLDAVVQTWPRLHLYTFPWSLPHWGNCTPWSWDSGCSDRQLDPVNCPVGTVLEFLQACFSAGLAHSTLKVHVAAIAAYHAPLGGLSVGKTL